MAIGWKPHNFGMNSFVVKNVPTDMTQNTLVVPLNTVIDPAVTIAFFKLDVEGFECEALKGARDLFRRKQVRTIFVELNEPLLLKGGCSLDGLKSLLAELCIDVTGFPHKLKPGTNPDFTGIPLENCTVL